MQPKLLQEQLALKLRELLPWIISLSNKVNPIDAIGIDKP